MTRYIMIADMVEEDMDRVVFRGFTRRELHEAFKLVENQSHWKLSIDRILPATTTIADLNKISAAVVFFTGGECEITRIGDNKVHVTGPGYYNSVGP